MKQQTKGLMQIIIAGALIGFIPLIVRWGSNFGAYNLSFFRVTIAAIALYIWIKLTRSKLSPLKKEKGKLLFFGAIHGFIILGYFLSIQFISIPSAVLLMYSSSIWMIVFAHLILKEKITKKTFIALLIAIIGIVVVLSPQSFFVTESFIGSIAGLLAGMGFGLVYVLSKTFKHYNKLSLTCWQNIIAIPFVLPLLFIDLPRFTLHDSLIVLCLGTVFTAVPFVMIYKGLEKIKAQLGGIIILLDILFPIIFAMIVFFELPTLNEIIGGMLIILASYIAAKS